MGNPEEIGHRLQSKHSAILHERAGSNMFRDSNTLFSTPSVILSGGRSSGVFRANNFWCANLACAILLLSFSSFDCWRVAFAFSSSIIREKPEIYSGKHGAIPVFNRVLKRNFRH